MAFRWSEESTVKFVSEYVKHRCIWDKKNKDYKNKNARRYTYRKIVEAMGVEGFKFEHVQSKIKVIRSTYAQELKKIKNAKEAKTVYFPSLRWFYKLYNTLKNVDQTGAGNSKDDTSDNQLFLNSDEMELDKNMVEQCHSDDFIYFIEGNLEESNIKEKLDKIGGCMSNILPDQCDYIADYWKMSLKSLPDLQVVYALKLIEQALVEGELGNLNNHTKLICYTQPK